MEKKIKSSEIVAKATEKIPEEIRLNYTYGNVYLLDEMDVYITQLRSHAEKAGIMKREIKKRINLFPVYVQRYRNSLRTTMSDDLYEYITDNVLDEMHDEFENSLKVLFYSTKRQVDRVISNSNLSSAIADLTMIYLIASLERERDVWYCNKVNEMSDIPMFPIHDPHVAAIRQCTMCLLKALLPNDVSFMKSKEMMDAFKIFKKEINTSKIEFKVA